MLWFTLVLSNTDIHVLYLENSVGPDQLAPDEASWSGSALFSTQHYNSVLIEIMHLNWLETEGNVSY